MRPGIHRFALCLAVIAAVALPVAGCGGDDNDDQSSTSDNTAQTTGSSAASGTTGATNGGATGAGAIKGSTLALAADPSGAIAFDKTKLQGRAGETTIAFTNQSEVPHAVEIEGNGVEEESDTVTAGQTTVTADLKPGSYEFYCPIDSHREQGMEGTLTIK